MKIGELLLATIMVVLVLLLVFVTCKMIANAGVNRELAEKHLGSGSVCGDTTSDVARCTRGGQLFVCTVHGERVGCAEGDAPLPEDK